MSSKKFEELMNVPPSGDGFTVDAGLIGSLVGVSVLFARHRTGGGLQNRRHQPAFPRWQYGKPTKKGEP
ncbi:hypothetical protein [Synechococcus sp. UW140]|uniref:hypothetical protein n=1 Tax=Synechococcus sp. UW140 TaxID=368503 RepID=UPI0010BCFF0B|nr:hypothetical protein [Synechococcus sp. UW140]